MYTTYKSPPSPRPRSSRSRVLRSFGFFRVWPGLVPSAWPLDPMLLLLLFLPAQPSVCETFRSLLFKLVFSLSLYRHPFIYILFSSRLSRFTSYKKQESPTGSQSQDPTWLLWVELSTQLKYLSTHSNQVGSWSIWNCGDHLFTCTVPVRRYHPSWCQEGSRLDGWINRPVVWSTGLISSLTSFSTTHKVKTQQVPRSRGQRCGDIELVGCLANTAGPVPLVLDLRITHEIFGSSSDPSINGHLHYPNDVDRSLNETDADKIRKYRADCNNNPPNTISFISVISTSEAT
jgi:hypothetical protein